MFFEDVAYTDEIAVSKSYTSDRRELTAKEYDRECIDRSTKQALREKKKRSKLRTKYVLESLREEYLELQEKNSKLKQLLRENLPAEKAQSIIEKCASSGLHTALDRPDDSSEDATIVKSGSRPPVDNLADLTSTLDIEDDTVIYEEDEKQEQRLEENGSNV